MQAQARGEDDILSFVRAISQRKFTVEEAKQAKEVFMVGSNTMVGISCTALHHVSAVLLYSGAAADAGATRSFKEIVHGGLDAQGTCR